jgi:hypothetical protein
MLRQYLHSLLSGLLFITIFFTASSVNAAPAVVKAEDFAKQIRPALGELRVSRTPVRMPTWIPEGHTGPLGIAGGPFKDGYEVWLGTCGADTTFFTSAGRGPVIHTKHTLKLGDGTTAYVQNGKKVGIDWAVGPYCYRVGIAGYGTKADLAELTKIANSMKLVPPQMMKALPTGQDRLVADYEMHKQMAKEGSGAPSIAAPKVVVKPKVPARQPVRLQVASATLNKKGADKLVFVLDDEYGAPSAPGCWFTKKASLQGEKGGTVVWTKPITLKDGVNMDTAAIDVKGNILTLWYTPPAAPTRFEQKYSWDGTNFKFLRLVNFAPHPKR